MKSPLNCLNCLFSLAGYLFLKTKAKAASRRKSQQKTLFIFGKASIVMLKVVVYNKIKCAMYCVTDGFCGVPQGSTIL